MELEQGGGGGALSLTKMQNKVYIRNTYGIHTEYIGGKHIQNAHTRIINTEIILNIYVIHMYIQNSDSFQTLHASKVRR